MAIIKKLKITSVGENVEKLEPLCMAGRIKWYSIFEKQSGSLTQKVESLFDPAISLLSI